MQEIISFFITNWVSITAALGLIVGAARIIVKLTPTPKDDTILNSVVSFLQHVGLVIKN